MSSVIVISKMMWALEFSFSSDIDIFISLMLGRILKFGSLFNSTITNLLAVAICITETFFSVIVKELHLIVEKFETLAIYLLHYYAFYHLTYKISY